MWSGIIEPLLFISILSEAEMSASATLLERFVIWTEQSTHHGFL